MQRFFQPAGTRQGTGSLLPARWTARDTCSRRCAPRKLNSLVLGVPDLQSTGAALWRAGIHVTSGQLKQDHDALEQEQRVCQNAWFPCFSRSGSRNKLELCRRGGLKRGDIQKPAALHHTASDIVYSATAENMDTAMVDAFHALLSSDAVTHFSTSMYERLGGLLPLLPCTWRAMYAPRCSYTAPECQIPRSDTKQNLPRSAAPGGGS